MIKRNWKKIIFSIALILLSASIGAYANTILNATEVTYEKSDGNTIMVNEALDELYAKAQEATTKVFSQGQLVTYQGNTFYSLDDVTSNDILMEIFPIYCLNNEELSNNTFENYKVIFNDSAGVSFKTGKDVEPYGACSSGLFFSVRMGLEVRKLQYSLNAKSWRLPSKVEVETWVSSSSTEVRNMAKGTLNTMEVDQDGVGYLNYWIGTLVDDSEDIYYFDRGDYVIWF